MCVSGETMGERTRVVVKRFSIPVYTQGQEVMVEASGTPAAQGVRMEPGGKWSGFADDTDTGHLARNAGACLVAGRSKGTCGCGAGLGCRAGFTPEAVGWVPVPDDG